LIDDDENDDGGVLVAQVVEGREKETW